MTLAHTPVRLFSAFEGCYEAPRAAALSGVPVSTVYEWARNGLIVPTLSPSQPKRWSYADLMALRVVYWLRHAKDSHPQHVPASPMGEVKRALLELDEQGIELWSEYDARQDSPLRVDPGGRIHVVTADSVSTIQRQFVFGETLDLLGPFAVAGSVGPDLVQPRPTLRIVPGKVSGEPHIVDSRIPTQTIAALFERFGDVQRVVALYPEISADAVADAVDLERGLAA